MSLPSRFLIGYLTASKGLPIFHTVRRALDYGDKGKAEENVYFRKEEKRLLNKLRKYLKLDKSNDASKDNSENKSVKKGHEKK